MINELGFYYQPELALAQASACRRRLATNASIFGFMAGLEVALLFIAPMFGWSDISSLLASLLPWYLIGLLISVLAALVAYRKAANDAKSTQGLAIGINRDGVIVLGQWLPWSEAGEFKIAPRRWRKPAHLVVTSREGRQVLLPLAYTDAGPAELDIAIRTLSAGRARVDLSGLDS